MKKYARVLSIAGSDSGGGAGIQADLKTFSALGCFGMSAITAVTAQNTKGVQSIFPMPCQAVSAQIEAVFSDIGVDAVKIGMLYDRSIIHKVGEFLDKEPSIPAVIDPVMYAKGGSCLLQDVEELKFLFPKTLLITPNLPETSALLGREVTKRSDMPQAAEELLQMGAKNVLLKGGHLKEEQGADCFCSERGEITWIASPTVATQNTHGTGCTYSSAIAAFLAKGLPLLDAIHQAKSFLYEALLAGSFYQIGAGIGPLHHFFRIWS